MKNYIILVLFIITLTITGCGTKSKKELEEYYTSMNTFYQEVAAIKSQLEEINISNPDFANADTGNSDILQVLNLLDELQVQFDNCANTSVPAEFSPNTELSLEASQYMSEAVKLFHEYLDDLQAPNTVFDAAYENYSRAMYRVSLMSSILKGEIPDDNGITYSEETTDFVPITE